jgi:hypothetical protein
VEGHPGVETRHLRQPGTQVGETRSGRAADVHVDRGAVGRNDGDAYLHRTDHLLSGRIHGGRFPADVDSSSTVAGEKSRSVDNGLSAP